MEAITVSGLTGTSIGTNAANVAVPDVQTPVDEAASLIDHRISQLNGVIEALAVRLQPVISVDMSSVPSDPFAGQTKDDDVRSAHTRRLAFLAQHIEESTDTLRSILGRLEI